MKLTYIGLLVGLAISWSACATATPEVRLLGMVDSARPVDSPDQQAVRVFLEVVNPGDTGLTLSRMHYELRANGWATGIGEIGLQQSLPARSSTVIEVPLTLSPIAVLGSRSLATDYTLDAHLFARSNRLSRSWRVHSRGQLDAPGTARASSVSRVSVKVATTEQ